MFPSISFPTILFISSILILMSTPQNTIAAPSLIAKACSNDSIKFDTELCFRILESIPSIVTAKDLFGLSIAIIEAGISNSTNTCAHIENMLTQTNVEPQRKAAIRECKLSYDQVVGGFRAALGQVRSKEYVAPTYELLTASTDCIQSCEYALTLRKIEDEIILRGNEIVPIFGISAFSAIVNL